jgi:hypothetical protein
MTWEITAEDPNALDGTALTRTVALYFDGRSDGPKLSVRLTLPKLGRPAPVFLVPGFADARTLLQRGYGLVVFNPNEVEPDRRDGSYDASIRRFFARPGQVAADSTEWGAIGAWAWAMSRIMDYLETDRDVDATKVSIMGVSRYGKVVMWAGAQDTRFAIVFSGESGEAGATLTRRGYGETLKNITDAFPYWFAPKFGTYATRVHELPVDWHELIALIAPRPVYIATAEQDYWGDPRGSFLAAKHAEPVYALYGLRGLGVAEMPAVATPVGDYIGYHMRTGRHGLNAYDWEQFLNFADRHLGVNRR